MSSLSPQTLAHIGRLDLRARMVVKGFLQGLHASPFHGFSVQFSEHRRYNRGDDPRLIDWLAYAKTDKYFVKRFEAETNLTGYLVMDLSRSMVTPEVEPSRRGESMTKFEYCTLLAASLTYLMTMQQDSVGLVAIGESMRALLPARSRRGHLGDVMAKLSSLEPTGAADLPKGLTQVAAMLRHQSLVMIFSDLLPGEQFDDVISSLSRLRHGGNDVILFHVLDQSEVEFPYEGPVLFEDSESGESITVDATGFRDDYLAQVESFRESFRLGCNDLRIDYVPLDTGMPFDKALTEYLIGRQGRF